MCQTNNIIKLDKAQFALLWRTEEIKTIAYKLNLCQAQNLIAQCIVIK